MEKMKIIKKKERKKKKMTLLDSGQWELEVGAAAKSG